jgi:hypothetical protein
MYDSLLWISGAPARIHGIFDLHLGIFQQPVSKAKGVTRRPGAGFRALSLAAGSGIDLICTGGNRIIGQFVWGEPPTFVAHLRVIPTGTEV